MISRIRNINTPATEKGSIRTFKTKLVKMMTCVMIIHFQVDGMILLENRLLNSTCIASNIISALLLVRFLSDV
jgi:hypothetical protein